MGKIDDLRGQLDDRRQKAAALFEKGGEDFDLTVEEAAEVKALNDEMTDLGAQIDEFVNLDAIRRQNDELGAVQPHPGHAGPESKREKNENGRSIGDLFVDSPALKGWQRNAKRGPVATFDVSPMATLFETATGWAPPDIRGPRVVDFATRPLAVAQLFPQSTTNNSSVIYMEETTFTNSAAEVAEGGLKPEVALALTERNEPVRKIGAWIPATDEQLEDVPQVRAYINNRLGFMVRQRLDLQLLAGDGTAPNISGILDRSIQSQAKASDPTPDAVYKAMTKIRVNAFAEPNATVWHPNDWQDVRLLRTLEGVYIWGSPSDAGPERIWGLSVVQTTAMTENTALVGDFQQAELVMRSGVSIQVTDSHADYFIYNKQVILAELRAALAVYRPAAFCKVTGI